MHIIFTRICCTLFTCDMYMCRLRHINDSVLSSLKMEGIRLLYVISGQHRSRRASPCGGTPSTHFRLGGLGSGVVTLFSHNYEVLVVN
jgi:hypothetical protein